MSKKRDNTLLDTINANWLDREIIQNLESNLRKRNIAARRKYIDEISE
jgi:hypothetical protein